MKINILLLLTFFSHIIFAQDITTFNKKFKNYLINDFRINTNNDSEISVQEAEKFTGLLKVDNLNLGSLSGIEYFTNLDSLSCRVNAIEYLNLSKNVNLKFLDCGVNQLTNLDISNNKELIKLVCHGNQLKNIDLYNNIKLETLDCNGNQFGSLDLSKNSQIKSLSCASCQLTELDVTKNDLLENLTFPYNNVTSVDLSHNLNLKRLNCTNNSLEYLDLSNNKFLIEVNPFEIQLYDNPNLKYVCVSPSQYTGNWSKDEMTQIITECVVGISDRENQIDKVIFRVYDVLGQEVSKEVGSGIFIIQYIDGTIKKVYNQ